MHRAKDKDGLPRKVVGTSCVCVVDFGEEGRSPRKVIVTLMSIHVLVLSFLNNARGEAYNFMMKHLGK